MAYRAQWHDQADPGAFGAGLPALAPQEAEMATITDHEAQQIDKANQTGRTPAVFVHGLSGWREVADTALAFVKRSV